MIQATHKGALAEGIDVYVCHNNGQPIRLFSKRGAVAALTGSCAAKSSDWDRFVERIQQESPDFAAPPVVEFRTPQDGHGSKAASGITDLDFVRVAKHFSRALIADRLREDQKHIGRRCAELVDQFADVGVAAVLDAAAGYKAQAEDYLSRIPLLRESPAQWEMHWDLELRGHLARAHGVPASQAHKMHPCYQHANSEFYRCALGDEVYRELKRRNPNPAHGSNHHQWIAEECNALLRRELATYKMLAELAQSKQHLINLLQTHYRKAPLQLFLASKEAA